MTRRARLLPGLLIGIGAAGSLIGCANGTSGAVNARSTLIIAIEGEPSTLTTHLSGDLSALMVACNVFNGLVGYDYDFNPTPDLAERWDTSPDGLVYTFHLNEQATWHDGRPVTAADAEYTFEFPVLNAVSARFADVVTTPNGYIQSRERAYRR